MKQDPIEVSVLFQGAINRTLPRAYRRGLTSHLHVLPPHLLTDAVGTASEALSGDGKVVCWDCVEDGGRIVEKCQHQMPLFDQGQLQASEDREDLVPSYYISIKVTYQSCPEGC